MPLRVLIGYDGSPAASAAIDAGEHLCGRSAVEEIVLGSVAMATLHHACRPVLVAPPAGRRPVTGQLF